MTKNPPSGIESEIVHKPGECSTDWATETGLSKRQLCQLFLPLKDAEPQPYSNTEHEQIINISSNHRMKQLMDWLSNSHWTPDTGMLTYLFLSNGTQANRDHSCSVQHCFEEFTSHQLDLRRPTVHANLALKSEQNARVMPGHLSSSAYYLESSKPTHLLYFQP